MKILLVLFLAAGCAGARGQVQDDESPATTRALALGRPPQQAKKIDCEHEHPTGSHVAKLACREADEVEKTSQRTQIILETMPHQAACNSNGCQGSNPGNQ